MDFQKLTRRFSVCFPLRDSRLGPLFRTPQFGRSGQVDAEQPNFRIARQSAGASQSRTWGQYRLSPGVEAVLVAQLCDVRLESLPPGKSRFAAIGRQYAIL